MMADTRREIYIQLQMVLAWHPTVDGLAALSDSIASNIVFCATDLKNAEEILAALQLDILKTIRENWDHTRRIRAESLLAIHSRGQP